MSYLINMSDKKIQIKQIKSAIGYNVKTKKTLEALGIRKMNHIVLKNDSQAIRGMINKVQHLVEVKEV
mgnify:CR=1 FL=1